MGENIGAAARAMWNFGLDRMRVVAPRDGWPNERAVALASGRGGFWTRRGWSMTCRRDCRLHLCLRHHRAPARHDHRPS
jgi:tRNA/rRNA methyltransferase